MSYQQFQPHPLLSEYIDAYWVVRNDTNASASTRILPDLCVDIIVNLGVDFLCDNGEFTMKYEAACLVGTMTKYIDVETQPSTHLVGIRFKPLGFSTFYNFASLHEITNKTIHLDKKLAPDIHDMNARALRSLDAFFMNKLSVSKRPLTAIVDHVRRKSGNVSVLELVREHAISLRQLERAFKQHIGLSPKEFINFKRYEKAVDLIRRNERKRSLLDIALDCGYYDHSHLTNEIRKYSGMIPSLM